MIDFQKLKNKFKLCYMFCLTSRAQVLIPNVHCLCKSHYMIHTNECEVFSFLLVSCYLYLVVRFYYWIFLCVFKHTQNVWELYYPVSLIWLLLSQYALLSWYPISTPSCCLTLNLFMFLSIKHNSETPFINYPLWLPKIPNVVLLSLTLVFVSLQL